MTEETEHPSASAPFPIKAVEDIDWWTMLYGRFRYFCVWSAQLKWSDGPSVQRPCQYRMSGDPVDLIRKLYPKKIGELGSYWEPSVPIEYRHAKIKLGDVFDYYTTSEGVLKTPEWSCLKYAVDEYMEESPRLKFHLSLVRQFIQENGIDSLELMG